MQHFEYNISQTYRIRVNIMLFCQTNLVFFRINNCKKRQYLNKINKFIQIIDFRFILLVEFLYKARKQNTTVK
jgi:hypothetical protein